MKSPNRPILGVGIAITLVSLLGEYQLVRTGDVVTALAGLVVVAAGLLLAAVGTAPDPASGRPRGR